MPPRRCVGTLHACPAATLPTARQCFLRKPSIPCCPFPKQTWCSSSTCTSAGSTEWIPTGSMSLAPAEWTRCRTKRQWRTQLPPQLWPTRTNQRARRKMTKQSLNLPPCAASAEGQKTCRIKAGRKVVV